MGGRAVRGLHRTHNSQCVFRAPTSYFLAPSGKISPHSHAQSAVFNKTSAFAFDEEERLRLAAERPHVLLLGDSDGDATMSEGINAKVLLKIGILNDAAAVEAALPKYLGLFDVVVVDDPPLWPLLDILQRLGV